MKLLKTRGCSTDSVNGSNLLDVLQRFLGLDLDDDDEGIVGLLEVFDTVFQAEPFMSTTSCPS